MMVFGSWAATAVCLADSKADAPAVDNTVIIRPQTESPLLKELNDGPLTADQSKLLDMAFDAATTIPLYPHVKTRAAQQLEVVKACFELDQPLRALRYIEQIPNWRRGVGYADFAFYCASHGHRTDLDRYLDLAKSFSQTVDQDWQRDMIMAIVAKTLILTGQEKTAESLVAGVDESQVGKTSAARAIQGDVDAFKKDAKRLDQMIATGSFDPMKNGYVGYTHWFNQLYDHKDIRDLIEQKITSTWTHFPVFVRVELLLDMARYALAHEDKAKALDLVNQAQDYVDKANWPIDALVPVVSHVSILRYRVGEQEKAHQAVDTVMAEYDKHEEKIESFYRAGIIRPAAEAYQEMGDEASALSMYRRTVSVGAININARPRAEDLSATCRSMALHHVKPDAQLWQSIKQIREGLSDPW